jgi:hypothetical protein
MKKQFVIIGIVALLVCGCLSGCNSLISDKDKFVGTWKTSLGVTSVLFSDGTCTIASVNEIACWSLYLLTCQPNQHFRMPFQMMIKQ